MNRSISRECMEIQPIRARVMGTPLWIAGDHGGGLVLWHRDGDGLLRRWPLLTPAAHSPAHGATGDPPVRPPSPSTPPPPPRREAARVPLNRMEPRGPEEDQLRSVRDSLAALGTLRWLGIGGGLAGLPAARRLDRAPRLREGSGETSR